MRRNTLSSSALVFTAIVAVAGCSSSNPSSSTPAPTKATTSPGSGHAAPQGAPCHIARPAPPAVVPVAGTQHDYTMTSFDGAQIRFHWYPLDRRAPTVLMGPGWGEPGATENSGTGLFGDSPIGQLQADGYHVLTWDPRGFGKSTGTIEVDSKDAEARDVQGLIDWVATQPLARLDAPTDPRVGMVGGSYGGGIQLQTAAVDCRIDAIVPTIAWHSLTTSLNKAQTVKIGWSKLLYSAAAGRKLDPHITSSYNAGITTGVISPADRAWFASRGPGDQIAKIKIPTLFIQGTVDTLFTLDEAVTNYRNLVARGVPTAMLWYCGGHGVCLTNAGDAKRSQHATTLWLQRWLQGDRSVDTGPPIDIIDQHGDRFTARRDPIGTATLIGADGSGRLPLTADGGSGPAHPASGSGGPIGGVATGIAPAPAKNAVNVVITATVGATSVGAPRLDITYSGTAPAGDRPTRVFAQLVDDGSGLVLGNQVTPIAVTLDGHPHTASVALEMIAHTLAPGDTITLQIVATTVAYSPPRFGGSIEFTKIHIALPKAAGRLKRT